ncbi:tRNA modification GTPase [Planctomyces sp. SH-PL62]|uniref:tRNA modification GTPase n=1 Tax=Planctomyces sp. SH-PL62 TaxID=1636152 RepID=UPI00078EBF11|nr:GTPase [Planctomyces sp. SH-PL62]AMV36585.1 tRNA modification GTPase MnmE [Planctomyces sp. SH-PL62]
MSSAFDPEEPIAATASAPGPGLRGIVRVSGPGAWRIALDGFEPDREFPTPTRSVVVSGRYRLPGLRPFLPADVALWPAPRTYTGQELAEIHAPGSPPLLGLLLAHCLAQGARPAQPGEFTLRAFLSGRLDLTRAEAVLGVIDARDDRRLEAALEQLAGGVAGPIEALRDRLLDLLAHLEADLDFVDEADVDPIGRVALADRLAREAEALDALTDRLGRRDRAEGNPRVVLVGPPNAGKSRLFNALLGGDHAIVSPLAGTTRDYLSGPCACDGLVVDLVDTAGIEAAVDAIAAEAQGLRASEAERADVLLACASADAPAVDLPVDDDRALMVWTKADRAGPPLGEEAAWIVTSASTGMGIDALRRALAAAIRGREGDHAATGTSARCRDSLIGAAAAIRDAADVMRAEAGDELIAFELRTALDDLGKVTGAVVADDVLDRIFARFCIGK